MNDTDNGNVLSTIDPTSIKRVHLVGVAGTGMGSFAGMLKASGYEVTGSDENVYPPMSDMLKTWGIQALTPYSPSNLDIAKPDLVIIGNVIRRVNTEATAARERKLPQMSFPAAMGSLFLSSRHSIVVAGTHGKTTTSSLFGHVLTSAGRDPSFLVGGVTQNYAGNFRVGKGNHVVIEGDEYDTAYFDKGPKFLHYQAKTLVLTSIEFDHADIYRDLAHYESAFEKLLKTIPPNGFISVCAEWPNAVRMAKASAAKVMTYSARESQHADLTARAIEASSTGTAFDIMEHGTTLGRFFLPMTGLHNVENALGVFAAARSLGLSAQELKTGFESFSGVKRRQEIRGEPGGVLVIDDFAHHPTAVKETIAAIRARWPERPLWAVFEPRSNTSRRNIHQHEYTTSFDGSSRVTLKTPERHDKIPQGEELDVPKVASDLKSKGIAAEAHAAVADIQASIVKEAKRGDVVLVMSNGSFGGLIDGVLKGLAAR